MISLIQYFIKGISYMIKKIIIFVFLLFFLFNVQGLIDHNTLWEVGFSVFFLGVLGLYHQRKIHILNTNLQQKTQELENSLYDFKYLFNNSLETMGLFQDNICVNLNEAGVKLFKFKDLEDALGKSPLDFIAPDSIDIVKHNISASSTLPYEVNAIKQDGTIFSVLIKGQYTEINGKLTRITSLLDLTALKKKEAQLQNLNNSLEDKIAEEVMRNRQKDKLIFQQNKLISMGEMINNIAHQWRQPLSSINNSVILMNKKLKHDLPIETELNNIEDTVQYMSNTIDDFQDFFKQNKDKRKFDIQETINKAISLLDNSFKKDKIRIINSNSKIVILNYSNELQQVLLVLLNNARDAIKQSQVVGNIEIKTIENKSNNQVKIEIYNNGNNIKDDILDKIFEPYFTTKHKSQGTGLGLYISKMIVNQSMNGELLVHNTENGVCFTILLDKWGGEFVSE